VSEVVLAAEGVSVRLGGAVVLREVSVSVRAGEVLGIFGPSGAGKSTLFRVLAGEERLAAGRVLLDGADVTARPLWERARRGLGYVPQTPSVLLDLTVAQNLAVFERLGPRRPGAPRAEELIDDLGLGGRAHVRASALSGGERRRLELARALSAVPRVLLCDEPFAALDPRGTERAGAKLRALAAGGAAVVLADHHVAEALRLCDRAVLLLGGEIAVVAPPVEFCKDPRVERHYAVAPSGHPGDEDRDNVHLDVD
jgi:lipopolysaccharide export system ATP-binding protein